MIDSTTGGGPTASPVVMRRAPDRPANAADAADQGLGTGPVARLASARPDHELAELPEFLQQAARGDRYLAPHPVIDGNATRLLVGYPAFEAALLRDLEAANDVINASMFIWRDDGLGRTVNDILKRKAAAGVEVNAIFDGVGSSQTGPFPTGMAPWMTTKKFESVKADLTAAGVNVRTNWRFGGSEMSTEANRGFDHRKAVQIDGRTSYVGGINLAEEYGQWHDTMLRIEGPASARVGAHLIGRWKDVGGDVTVRNLAATRDAAAAGPAGDARVEILANNGPAGPRHLTASFLKQVATAERRIWILSPSIGSPQAVEELADASRRGVDVRVIVPTGATRDADRFNWLMTTTFFHDLVDAGVDLRQRPDVTPHAKVWLVDDDVTTSSYNLSNRSNARDFELGARVMDDPHLLADAEALFAADTRASVPVTAEALDTPAQRALRFVRAVLGLKY